MLEVDATEDSLDLSLTVTEFTSLASVLAAASEVIQDGQSGVLIDLGGSQAVFIDSLLLSDLTTNNLIF